MMDIIDLANILVLRLSSIALGKNPIAASSLSELQAVEALDALLQTARALAGRLINRHRLLDRIPPEILIHIFSLVSKDDPYQGYRHNGNQYWAPISPAGRPRGLVPLTAVCQRWRDILLQTPWLWSIIDDHAHDELPSFVHYVDRCSRGPLFVHIHSWLQKMTLEFLASRGQRVRDLIMDHPGPHDIVSSFRAEELRRCRLYLRGDSAEGYTGPPFQTFFQGCAPQLQGLQLLNSPFLPCNHFPALAYLILDCPSWVVFSIRDLQVFLSGCPRLQSLHIQTRPTSYIKPPSDTTSPMPIFRASQHLRKFSMIDATKSHDPIWRPVDQARVTRDRITHSAIRHVLLSTVVQSPQCLVYIDRIVSSVVRTFMDQMSTLIKPSSSSMRIVHKYETLNRMGVRIRPRISLTLIHPSEPGGVRFNVQPGDDTENEEIMRLHLRRGIAASPLFSDIRELWMDGNAPQLLRPPHSILRSLPNLQYLQVLCDELDEWISQGTFEALAHAEGGGLVCPQLESLNVLVLSEQPTERAQVVFEQIRALVERRIGLGRPLKRLCLSMIVSPSRTSNSRLILETRRELGSLVEHFDLHVRKRDSGRFPNVD